MKHEHESAVVAGNHCTSQNDTQDSTARSRSSARLNLIARSVQAPATTPERFAPGSYNFAYGTIRTDKPKPAPLTLADPVESTYELLGKDDVLIAPFTDLLDAFDALRVHRGPGKVVRTSDRALLKVRHPHKGRP